MHGALDAAYATKIKVTTPARTHHIDYDAARREGISIAFHVFTVGALFPYIPSLLMFDR